MNHKITDLYNLINRLDNTLAENLKKLKEKISTDNKQLVMDKEMLVAKLEKNDMVASSIVTVEKKVEEVAENVNELEIKFQNAVSIFQQTQNKEETITKDRMKSIVEFEVKLDKKVRRTNDELMIIKQQLLETRENLPISNEEMEDMRKDLDSLKDVVHQKFVENMSQKMSIPVQMQLKLESRNQIDEKVASLCQTYDKKLSELTNEVMEVKKTCSIKSQTSQVLTENNLNQIQDIHQSMGQIQDNLTKLTNCESLLKEGKDFVNVKSGVETFFECKICHKELIRWNGLRRHMRDKHKLTC